MTWAMLSYCRFSRCHNDAPHWWAEMVVPGATMSGLMRPSGVGPMLVKYARLSNRSRGSVAVATLTLSTCNSHEKLAAVVWHLQMMLKLGENHAGPTSCRWFCPHTFGASTQNDTSTDRHTCPLASASNTGLAELRGRDAEGMLIVGGSKPGIGSSGLMRMKPVSSVLLMNTAAALAACALTTCVHMTKACPPCRI